MCYVRYSREFLCSLADKQQGVSSWSDLPSEIRRRTKRGKRAGTIVKEVKKKKLISKRRFKPCLPSLVIGNVRSLNNDKMDMLEGLTVSQREFREASLLCFTETWREQCSPTVTYTSRVRQDRDRVASGKSAGGGVTTYVNKYCNPGHISVKARICTPGVELLAIGLRPYYVPREFSHIIVITTYIPPSARAASASDVIHSLVSDLQTKHPCALMVINADFNHASLTRTLTGFTQYVRCATRGEKSCCVLYFCCAL